MNKQLMSMEEPEQVTGGNIFDDAWDWLCDKAKEAYEKINPLNPVEDSIHWTAGR